MGQWTSTMENLVNFWKGKRVFITGHTGFKGSWLSLWLQYLKADVIGFSLEPPTERNLFTEANVAEGMIDIRGDIRDYNTLYSVLREYQPDIIFHLAAQALVRHSYAYPIDTYSTNVMGTVHLLEAARHCATLRVIINVTTDKCYANQEKISGYSEIDPLGGSDPYSSSKACSELITNAYRQSYFQFNSVALASARAGNVIGGGDWAKDRLITDLIATCVEGKKLDIRYPESVRPWQHVLECLSGYLCLAKHLYEKPHDYAEAWNFGPNERDEKSVEWIARKILTGWGITYQRPVSELVPMHETRYLTLNCSKAQSKLGWKPRLDINKTIASVVSWYQDYYQGVHAKTLTLNQIVKYMANEKIAISL